MKLLLFIILNFFSGSLFSCEPFLNSTVVNNSYAEYFRLYRHDKGWFIDILSREKSLRSRYSIGVKHDCKDVKHLNSTEAIGIASSTYLPYLRSLGTLKNVTHVMGKNNFYGISEFKQRTLDIGVNPNVERILRSKMSIFFGYSLNDSTKDLFTQLSLINYPVVLIHEFLEETALARVEWIKVFGVIFNKYDESTNKYKEIEKKFKSELSSKYFKNVLIAQEYEGAWYVPGSNSFLYQMLSSLGANVLLSEGKKNRTKVNREEILNALKRSSFWFPQSNIRERKKLLKYLGVNESDLGKLKIFNISKKIDKNGSNDFWQSAIFRPDLVIKDLKLILSNDAKRFDQLKWYEQI